MASLLFTVARIRPTRNCFLLMGFNTCIELYALHLLQLSRLQVLASFAILGLVLLAFLPIFGYNLANFGSCIFVAFACHLADF